MKNFDELRKARLVTETRKLNDAIRGRMTN